MGAIISEASVTSLSNPFNGSAVSKKGGNGGDI
jgi:hypothetical protein